MSNKKKKVFKRMETQEQKTSSLSSFEFDRRPKVHEITEEENTSAIVSRSSTAYASAQLKRERMKSWHAVSPDQS